jgi:hypothetical protein
MMNTHSKKVHVRGKDFGHVHEHFGCQKALISASFPLQRRFASLCVSSSWHTRVRSLKVGADQRSALGMK